MLDWIKKHTPVIITAVVTVGILIFVYGCDSRVKSMYDNDRLINRQELQLELDQFMALAQIRMVELDKQDQLRAVILQNALILVQGQPLNIPGLITAVAGIYGVIVAGRNAATGVKKVREKRKANNG